MTERDHDRIEGPVGGVDVIDDGPVAGAVGPVEVGCRNAQVRMCSGESRGGIVAGSAGSACEHHVFKGAGGEFGDEGSSDVAAAAKY